MADRISSLLLWCTTLKKKTIVAVLVTVNIVFFICILWIAFSSAPCGHVSPIVGYHEELLRNHPHLQFLFRHTYCKAWLSDTAFPNCTIGTCLDDSRCQLGHMKIYHYGPPFQPAKFFTRLESSPWHTSDPQKACLFLVTEPEDFDFFRPHPSTLPHWNGGQNHVILSFADKWVAPAAHTIGKASMLGSQLHQSTYRPGFDISLPLPPSKSFSHLQNLKPFNRKYFLTFKGTRYLGETDGDLRGYPSFKDMHNGKDVVVAVTCNHPTNEKIRKHDPKYAQGCDEDDRLYHRYDFTDLMNSTFCLTPAGRSFSSYRFIEALSGGSIPVLICDDYVLPFHTLIQWDNCMLRFSTSQMHHILYKLRALTKEEVEHRQSHCLFIFNQHFKDDDTLLNSTMVSLKLRFRGVSPDVVA